MNKNKLFIGLVVILLGLSFFLRIHDLENRPIHHDESINGWTIQQLLEKGDFKYEPKYYHGPTLFFLGEFFCRIFGNELGSLRLLSAFFGFLLCLLPLGLKKELKGNIGILYAVLLFSFSPAMLFFSRYAIHEMLFCFFVTLGAVFLYYYMKNPRWYWILPAGIFLGYAAATKETIILFIGGIFLGFLFAVTFSKPNLTKEKITNILHWKNLIIGIIAFFLVLFSWFGIFEIKLFFQSYFFYWQLGSGEEQFHIKPWWYLFHILWTEEWFILVPALGGIFFSLREKDFFSMFCLGWGIFTLSFFSMLSYKTPWLILSLLPPFIFLGGIFCGKMIQELKKPVSKILFMMGMFGIFIFSFSKTYSYSFLNFLDGSNRYAYAHHYESVHMLEKRVKNILQKNPKIQLAFLSDKIWPYPYLWRHTKQVLYIKKIPQTIPWPMVICKDEQLGQLKGLLPQNFKVEYYPIWGDLGLYLFIHPKLSH